MLKKRKPILLLCLLIVTVCAAFFLPYSSVVTAAEGSGTADGGQGLSQSVDEILNEIDLAELEAYLASLDQSRLSVFGGASATEKIRMIVAGDMQLDYGNFFGYILEVVGVDLLAFLPVMITILAIAIAMNILNSAKGKLASDSVGNVISFSGTALTAAILAAQIMVLIVSVRGLVTALQTQMSVVFPIVLTLMAASGGVTSTGVYRPAVAVLSTGIMEIIVSLVLPLFILSSVFTIVGNLSDTVRLKKMSDFFMKACKWLLGTAFFLFVAFLAVQGITASVYDGVSVRTAKFAISKYVPVIGGYLSDGFNLVMAGSSLVKNAVGLTAVVLLFLSILPAISQTVVFNLSLHLCAAVSEPLGDKKISNILSGIGKNSGTLIAVLLGAAFLYFIFLILVICTGNPSL